MKRNQIIVVLENIRSALNVGAMFRTADATLVEKLMLTGITPYPPHNRIPKTALGAIEYVPWAHIQDTNKALKAATKDRPLIAVELTEDADIYTDFNFSQPCSIIFGNEISGVSDVALSKCSAKVKIPMLGQKESLNVATSFGIIVYEILRQWGIK